MNKMMRKTVIAGNWKMNNTPSQALKLIEELKPLVKDATCDVVVCVPYVDLLMVIAACKDTNIKVGAQNLHFEPKGAYTGEVSADMLKEIGVQYVVIGHSERREYFGETDETVNKKVHAALNAGITPILCCGESLSQREDGVTGEWVRSQIKIALKGITAAQVKDIIIAYEPIWAIGTGKTATADQADEVCGIIRQVLAELYDAQTAEGVTIQYGGSMNAGNCAELLSKYHVDGGLIGGASLKAPDFSTIVEAGSR
jgi:triosephosphate isomerase